MLMKGGQQVIMMSKYSVFYQQKKKQKKTKPSIESLSNFNRDRMVVGFTTTCAISTYHH